jgi:hypothetical protein
MEAKTSSELQAVATDYHILYGHRRDNLRSNMAAKVACTDVTLTLWNKQ